jgi:glycerate dehydrogenase
MKIVVLDGYTLNPGDISWSEIEKLGELTVYDRTPESEILNRIGDAEIIFTNKTPLTKDTIENVKNVKFIGVLATGYNVVNVEAAKERGIPVANIPAYGTDSVAQFVFALLLEICHHIQNHAYSVMDGEWTKSLDFCYWNYPLMELSGKTMGIIGYGRIGQAVSKIATAFGMKVLAYNGNSNKKLEDENVRLVTLDELFNRSDVISLHCPLFESTKGIINRENIDKMKDGVILINTSRGPLIVEDDLAEALNSGKVYAAGIDVVSAEPIKSDNPLLKAKNIFITPHIAWAPKEARARLMNIAADNLKAFIEGNSINVVNK